MIDLVLVSFRDQKLMKMKILTLIENETSKGQEHLKAEAGLSLFIEFGNQKILFDTGSSGAFADNAEKLGVDISKVDFVVISHAHFDHTGGLERFFQINKTAKVYINENVKGSYYYKLLFLKKNIGTRQDLFKNYSDRFIFVTDDLQINDNIKIITQITNNHKLPSDSKHIFTKKNDKFVPDDFSHEQMLVLTEGDKLHVFTGCSHHGIVNMVESAEHLANGKKMNVIGGFHMYNPLTKGLSEKKEDVIKVGELLNKNKGIDTIATGHCTGKGAFKILKGVLGDKLLSLNTGSQLII